MSTLSLFMKKNKAVRENTAFAATKSLSGEDGKPLLWEIKPLSTKDNENIREACTREIPVTGKTGMYRQKVNTSDYMAKMMVASIVFPDLYNAELQDSYGVKSPEDLLKEIIDDPGEYQELAVFIQRYNGFDVSMDERINEAKN